MKEYKLKPAPGVEPVRGDENQRPVFEFMIDFQRRGKPNPAGNWYERNEKPSTLYGIGSLRVKVPHEDDATRIADSVHEILVESGVVVDEVRVHQGEHERVSYRIHLDKVKRAKKFKPRGDGLLTFKVAFHQDGLFGNFVRTWYAENEEVIQKRVRDFVNGHTNRSRRKPYTGAHITCLDHEAAELNPQNNDS